MGGLFRFRICKVQILHIAFLLFTKPVTLMGSYPEILDN
jgi:hypothetical protein